MSKSHISAIKGEGNLRHVYVPGGGGFGAHTHCKSVAAQWDASSFIFSHNLVAIQCPNWILGGVTVRGVWASLVPPSAGGDPVKGPGIIST